MKLYISGPMSGLPEHNFPAFREARETLLLAGYDVFDPSLNFGGRTDLPRKDYMREDIGNVLRADGVAVLRDWMQSKGARLEVEIARELGIEVLPVSSWIWATASPAGPGTWPAKHCGRVLNDIAPDGLMRSGNRIRFETTKSETILEEAQRLVHGDRGASYGHPADDFGRTAAIWNALFADKLAPGKKFEAADIPLAQIGVKLSREVNKPKRDNMTDTCGYAETRRMVLEREGRG